MQVSTHRKQKKRKCRFLHVDNIHNDHRARLGRGSRPGQSLPHGRSRTCPRAVCIDPRQAPRGRSRRECPHGQSDCHCPRLNLILLCVCVCVYVCVCVCVNNTTQHKRSQHKTILPPELPPPILSWGMWGVTLSAGGGAFTS